LKIIRNIFIIQNGVPLVKLNFGECHSLGDNEDLIAGFIHGLESFTSKIMGSSLKSINVEDYIFYFYKDPSKYHLLFIFITEPDADEESIKFKMKKIAGLFIEKYSEVLVDFTGEVSQFNDFKDLLIQMNLAQKNCGGRPECEGCPNSGNYLKVLDIFKKEKKGFFKRLRSVFKRN